MGIEKQNSKKNDVILEACRRKGPMDETLVRDFTQACGAKANDVYCGNAIAVTQYLQFSQDKGIKQSDTED